MANSPFVSLDVGGKAFRLMRSTIQKYPNSTLVKVISGEDTTSALFDSGTYYFDRNPDYFTILTDYMRTGKVFLTANVSPEMFAVEAEFWGLSEAANTEVPKHATNAQKKPAESTVVIPAPIGPTLVLDKEFKPPTVSGNGYQVSFGANNSNIKQTSSEGSLASSVSPAANDPLLGNFIGGLELKTSIEAGSLKRKSEDSPAAAAPITVKRVKMRPRKIPSNEELQAAYTALLTLETNEKPVVRKPPVVVLSGFDLNERHLLSEKIKSLHGKVIDTFEEFPTHLILTDFKNTKKLLIAINKGLEVVSSRWVYESVQAGDWLPADRFYACTAADEQKHNFHYRDTLEKAKTGGFLRDSQFYISPAVRPSSKDFEEVVVSAGGKCIPKRPTIPLAGLYVIADSKSKEAEELTASGFVVRGSEWLCECVFQQRVF